MTQVQNTLKLASLIKLSSLMRLLNNEKESGADGSCHGKSSSRKVVDARNRKLAKRELLG